MMSSNASRSTVVRVLAAALFLAGCGKKAETPAGPDCATAVQNALTISKADIKAALPTMDDKGMEKVRVASIARCQEDKWSPEALTCMVAAKTSDDVGQCEKKKTQSQRDNLLKAIQEAAPAAPDPGPGSDGTAPAGSGMAPTGSGATPTGSGATPTGSASSGTAAGSANK